MKATILYISYDGMLESLGNVWRVIQDQLGLCVLRKRRAVFTPSLILLTHEGLGAIDHAIKKEHSRPGLAEIIIHDFDNIITKLPNLAGPAEILQEGRYGALVPVGDEQALTKAMVNALNTRHDHDALKRRAADFSPEIAANKYLQKMFPDDSHD